MANKLFTVKEAEQILKVAHSTIYTYISSGELETIKIGNNRRISEEALDKFIKDHTVK